MKNGNPIINFVGEIASEITFLMKEKKEKFATMYSFSLGHKCFVLCSFWNEGHQSWVFHCILKSVESPNEMNTHRCTKLNIKNARK